MNGSRKRGTNCGKGKGKRDDGYTPIDGVKRNGNGSSASLGGSGGGPSCGTTGVFAGDGAGGVSPAGRGGASDVPVKRVEVVHWSDLGHAWALGHHEALNEFVSVVNRQLEAFVDT